MLDDVLVFIRGVADSAQSVDENKLDRAIELLSEVSENSDENFQLSFIIEQLELSKQPTNNRRYIGQTLMLASTLYVQSSASYIALYNSKFVCFPHPRNIKKLIGKFSLLGSDLEGSIEYLKTKLPLLKDHEHIVNIHLDEIYVNPELHFKGASIVGCSKTDSTKIAKTVQVFMISSIFSKYKDVVSLIPVNNLTAQQLQILMLNVLQQIENVGFIVIAFVSDNNVVNRKAFELFSENGILQPYLPHPLDPKRLLFLIFDVVHILKCVRNNWISRRTDNCKLVFPDFEFSNNDTLHVAQFKHLEIL